MNKNNWTYKKLGEVATFSRGLTYSKKDVSEDTSKKVLRSNNIDLATNSLNYEDIAYLKEDFVIPEDKILHKNDIFICMSNGSTKHLGKVAFIETETDYAFGGFMGAIHPKTSEVFPKFAFYFCLSSEYRRCLATVLNGININNIKWSDLSKFSVPIPPLAEQERIVAELDLLSSIIEKKKAQLKELDQLAQSIFYDMFGDPITNEKGWDYNELSDLYKFIDYRGKTPNKTTGGIPLITAKNIRKGAIDYNVKEYISELEHRNRLTRGIPRMGDLLFTTEAPLGNAAIANLDIYATAQRLIVLQKKENVLLHNIYVLYYILSDKFQDELLKQATGSTIKGIKGSKLEKMSIPLPPLPLQQEFASKVEAIERQKSLIQQSIDEVQTMFDSRMDYWFG